MSILKYIFFPISIVYGGVTIVRNFLYRQRIFKSCEFDIPIICIGNLSMGGTGKTPHTEYLINLLKPNHNLAVLSRGYGRKTTDYIEAPIGAGAKLIGDEPAQFKRKNPEIIVSVEKKRVKGVLNLLYDNPKTDVILLDDAFQHRAIKPGCSVLLTDYNDPFYHDYLLPIGRLREFRAGKKRANLIIVTKCPKNISEEERKKITKAIKPLPDQSVFFSRIKYGKIYNPFTNEELQKSLNSYEVLIITGIANPQPLYDELNAKNIIYKSKSYRDHYPFSAKDVEPISKIFNTFATSDKIILTTEKDASRLVEIKEFENLPIYCIEIEIEIIENKEEFDNRIINYVTENKTNS